MALPDVPTIAAHQDRDLLADNECQATWRDTNKAFSEGGWPDPRDQAAQTHGLTHIVFLAATGDDDQRCYGVFGLYYAKALDGWP